MWLGGEDRRCYVDNKCHEMHATGDYVEIDNNGVMYYRGRRDEQIKVHGKRVNLREIEEVKRDNDENCSQFHK